MALYTPIEQLRDMQQWAASQALINDSNPSEQSRYLGQALAASVLINSSTDDSTGLDGDPFDNIWDL